MEIIPILETECPEFEEGTPENIIVRDVRREAICLMLGISTKSDDETILAHAKAWGESYNG